MTERIARLGISIASNAAAVKGDLRGLAVQSRETERATQGLSRATQGYAGAQAGAANALRMATGFMRAAQTAASGLIAALGVRQVVAYADAWTAANNRLRIVIDSTEELKSAQTSLFAISQRTFTSFGATADLYSRLAASTKDLNKSQAELLRLSETIGKAVSISGASAQAAQASLIQFGQAVSGDFKAAAQELNSITEQTPALATAIAEGLGVTRGELKKLAEQGELSTAKVFAAIEKMAPKINEQFERIDPTFGQLFQRLNNEITKFIGESEGAFAPFKSLLRGLVDNFGAVATAIEAATVALLTFVAIQAPAFIAQMAGALGTWFSNAVRVAQAQNELNAAVKAGNAILIGSAAAQQAQIAYAVEQAAANVAFAESQAATATTRLADARATEAQLRASLELIAVQRAEAASQLQLARGITAATGLRTAQAAAEANLARSMAAGLATRKALAATEAEIAAAQTLSATATAQLATAQGALVAASTRTAAATGFFARAAAQLRGVITGLWALLVANPLGIIATAIIGTVTALVVFRKEIAESAAGTRDWKLALEAVGNVIEKSFLGDAARGASGLIRDIGDALKWAGDKAGEAGKTLEDWLPPNLRAQWESAKGTLEGIAAAMEAIQRFNPLTIGIRIGSEGRENVIEETARIVAERARQADARARNQIVGGPVGFSDELAGFAGAFDDPFRAPIQIDPTAKPGLQAFERTAKIKADAEAASINLVADAYAKGEQNAKIFAAALELVEGKAANVTPAVLEMAAAVVTATDREKFSKASAAISAQITELSALSKAYGESVEAGRAQETAFKLFGDSAAAISEEGIARAREFLKAQDEAASVKLTAELEKQQEHLASLAGEYVKGERAARVYSEALKIAGQTSGEVTAATLELAEAIVKAQETQRTLETTAGIQRQVESIGRLRAGLTGSFRDFQVAAKQAELIADGWDEAAASSMAAAEAAVSYERALERINRQADRLAVFDFDPAEEFGENMADAATDVFVRFREEGFKAFKDLGASFKDTFQRLWRDIFAKNVLEPFLRPIIDALGGGAFGREGQRDITLRESSSDIVGAIGRSTDNIVSAIRNGPSPTPPPATGGVTGGPKNLVTGEGFDQQPAGLLSGLKQKFDQIAKGYEKVFRDLGKTLEGVSESFGKAIQNISDELADAAAGASAGFAGFGLGTSAADFINGRQGETGSKIGGAVGGGIGFAVGGPVGAFIGSAVGSFFGDILGGLFGRKTATGTLDFDTGEIEGKDSKKDSRNERRDTVLQSATEALRLIADVLGANFRAGFGLQVEAGKSRLTASIIDSATGRVITTGQGRDEEDIKGAVAQAIKLGISTVLEGGDAQLRRIADALIAADVPAEQLVNSLGDIASVLQATKEPVSEFRKALEALDKVFSDAARASGNYASAVKELAQAQFDALSALAGKFDKDIDTQLRQIENPVAQQFLDLLKAQDERVKDAEALNASLISAAANLSGAPTGAVTAFDPRAYISAAGNEDIARFFDENRASLERQFRTIEDFASFHFENFGRAEGRATGQVQQVVANDNSASAAGLQAEAQARLQKVLELNTAEFAKFIKEVANTPVALAQATSALAEFRQQLIAQGIDPSVIEQSLASAKATLASAFNEQIDADILALRSPTFAAFQELLKKQKELEDFATQVGGNLFAVQARNSAERAEFFKRLTDEQKLELGDFLGLIEDVSGRVGVVLTNLEDHISRYVEGAEEQARATLKAAEAFQGYADSIEDSLFNINSQFGKGNPEQRLQDLQEEFFRLANQARSGDESAFGKLGPLGEQIVGQARELFAGTAQFATIRDTITSALEGLRVFAADRATALFKDAENFNTELDALKEIRNLLADPQSNDLLRQILDSGRIQNDISRALVSELIALRDTQAQNDAVTLQQLQAATFAQSTSGESGQSSSSANDNGAALVQSQQQVAKAYTDFSRQQAKTNEILVGVQQSMDRLATEINRDRTQRALNQ